MNKLSSSNNVHVTCPKLDVQYIQSRTSNFGKVGHPTFINVGRPTLDI